MFPRIGSEMPAKRLWIITPASGLMCGQSSSVGQRRANRSVDHISKGISELSIPSTTRLLKRERENATERVARKIFEARRIIGLGEQHDHCTFEGFEQARQPDAYKAARAFLQDRGTLVLHGPNGTGKTHLAVAIAGELVKEWGYVTGDYSTGMGGVVGFWTFGDALRILRKTYRKGYDGLGEEWFMDRWRTIPVLVLDEVGQEGLDEKPSEFTRRIGYEIVDGRYRNGHLPIVMTTNQTVGGLYDWITKSAVDRLFEMGEFVKMEGRSYRLRGRK